LMKLGKYFVPSPGREGAVNLQNWHILSVE
jgi:hypothetical protein